MTSRLIPSAFLLLLVVITLGIHSSPARAVPTFGGEKLLDECTSAVHWLDKKKISDMQMAYAIRCTAYVVGMMDGIEDSTVMRKAPRLWCPPADISSGQAVRIVQHFAHEHPQYLDQDADILVYSALVAAFPPPCKQKK